ncbi:MAG: DUF1311 domain-containing protein [Burkholderiales bacterium]|nr:DUF1311 domain-containing protein [Burkholderiales bacterium]
MLHRLFPVFLLSFSISLPVIAETECDGSTARGSIACTKPTEELIRDQLKEQLSTIKMLMQSEGSFVSHAQYLKLFNDSQVAWVNYMESHCRLQGVSKSGPNTWSSYWAQQCELQAIDQRIQELGKLEKILRMEEE